MQQHIERIAKGSSMPRNGKEGILFSFIMSAIMIYVMAALNYGVRIGDVGAAAWSYALFDWPLGEPKTGPRGEAGTQIHLIHIHQRHDERARSDCAM